jgi:hypothetical protein
MQPVWRRLGRAILVWPGMFFAGLSIGSATGLAPPPRVPEHVTTDEAYAKERHGGSVVRSTAADTHPPPVPPSVAVRFSQTVGIGALPLADQSAIREKVETFDAFQLSDWPPRITPDNDPHMREIAMLAEIAAAASILGNATNIIDKIFSRFFEGKTGTSPSEGLKPEHSAVIVNDPAQRALVLSQGGLERARVTYSELGERLSSEEIRYINTRESVMNQLYEQWDAGYRTLATEMDPIRKTQLKQRLDDLAKNELGKEVNSVLGFINKAGLELDDHYKVFQHLAAR